EAGERRLARRERERLPDFRQFLLQALQNLGLRRWPRLGQCLDAGRELALQRLSALVVPLRLGMDAAAEQRDVVTERCDGVLDGDRVEGVGSTAALCVDRLLARGDLVDGRLQAAK